MEVSTKQALSSDAIKSMAEPAPHREAITITEEAVVLSRESFAIKAPMLHFAKSLADRIPWQSGVMPPGVLSIRQAGEYLQLVFQLDPGIYPVNWSNTEAEGRRGVFEVYQVAQPYRIIIGDFLNGQFVGARHFYSPIRVTSLDQELYHVNFPNTNCSGYHQTALGWICLYGGFDTSRLDVAAKSYYVLERASGQECYNDANMTGVDGPSWYRSRDKPIYLWNRHEWELQTQRHGVTWTLDETLWDVVEVADPQRQEALGQVPLTLRIATENRATMSYGDDGDRLLHKITGGKRITSSIQRQFYDEVFKVATTTSSSAQRSASPYTRTTKG